MGLFRRNVLTLLFASFLAGFQLTIFMAYLGLHIVFLNEDTLSERSLILVTGLIFFSRNFIQIFLRVPMGELNQIIGRKLPIVFGLSFQALAFFLMFFAQNWIVILIATLNIAIGMSFYWPAMFAAIGDVSTDNYGRINGFIFQGSDVGSILGSLLVSRLLSLEIVDLNGVFGVGGVLGAIGVILVAVTLQEPLEQDQKKLVKNTLSALIQSFRQSLHSLVKVTKIRPLTYIYLFQFIISFTEFFWGSFLPLLIVFHIGLTDADVADVILYGTLLIFLFKPYLGSISDKFGFRRPVVISLLLNAVILFSFPLVDHKGIVIILYALLVAVSLTSYLAVNGATSYAADPLQRGLAMGALGFWVSFGRSSSSIVLTPIWEIFGRTQSKGNSLKNLFQVSSVLILLVTVFFFYLSSPMNKISKNSIDT